MNYDNYKNTLPYGLSYDDTLRLNNLKTQLNKKKPSDQSHEVFGKYLDSIEAEIKLLTEEKSQKIINYSNEDIRLEDLFWKDAFDELGLNDAHAAVKALLRSQSWESGHSSGYQSVFSALDDLADIYHAVKRHELN